MDNNYSAESPTVVDLFCGAGGFSEGFRLAGYDIVAGLDFDKDSVETFKFNFPKAVSLCTDIKDMKPNDFIKKLGRTKINVVIGGPPCQGFSTANRQQEFIDDPRNILYKYFVDYVDAISPDIVVMENVSGIIKKAGEIKNDFNKIGYFIGYRILNAVDYGIPQNRKRVIFIGTKISSDENRTDFKKVNEIFSRIEAEKSNKCLPLKDALWGLRKISPMEKAHDTSTESEAHGFTEDKIIQESVKVPEYILKINGGDIPRIVYNHKARYNNKRDIAIFGLLPQGGKSDHPSIQEIMPYKSRSHIFKDKFYKLIEDKPCKTITSHMKFDCNMYIHPTQSRGLTPREAARVQSFPDSYRFIGSISSWYKQIGNAVPPQLALAIADSIRNAAVKSRIHFKALSEIG